MSKRSFNTQSAVFIVVAVVIMIVADFFLLPGFKPPSEEGEPLPPPALTQPAPVPEENADEVDQGGRKSEDQYGPHKHDFAPPLEMERTPPLLPESVDDEAEKREAAWITHDVGAGAS